MVLLKVHSPFWPVASTNVIPKFQYNVCWNTLQSFNPYIEDIYTGVNILASFPNFPSAYLRNLPSSKYISAWNERKNKIMWDLRENFPSWGHDFYNFPSAFGRLRCKNIYPCIYIVYIKMQPLLRVQFDWHVNLSTRIDMQV